MAEQFAARARSGVRWNAGAPLCSFIALLLAAAPARAAGLDLEWTAPAACPGKARVVDAIERLLGRSLEGDASDPVRARAEIMRDGERWLLRLSTDRESAAGPRELSGDTCEELADATALIIAIAIDPTAATRAPGRTSAASLPDATDPVVEPAAPQEPPSKRHAHAPAHDDPAVTREPDRAGAEDPPQPAAAVHGLVEPYFVSDFGSLPSVSPGAGLAAGIAIGETRIEAFGHFLAAQRATLPQGNAGGDLGLLAAGAMVCHSPLVRAPASFGACLGIEAGVLSGEGVGVTDPASGSAAWLAPEAAITARYAIGAWLRIGLVAAAVVPVLRERFILTDIGEIYRPPPLAARASLGLEASFP